MPKTYTKNRIAKELKKKPLTVYEEYIFKKIRKEFVDVNTILSIRNKFSKQQLKYFKLQKKEVSLTSIYNTIKNIEKKLGTNILLSKEQKNHLFIPKGSLWRVHATAFTIQILDATNHYLTRIKKQNKTFEENNTIQFHKNKLTIYSNIDFFGKTVQECLDDEANYWTNFLKLIQSKYQLLLIQRGKTKIYEFRKHIARVNDPIAKQVLKKGKDYHIKDDNGELIFVIDNSFNFLETESVHKTRGVKNALTYDKYFKDIDKHPESLIPSELTNISSINTANIKKLIELASKVPQLEQSMHELTQNNIILTKNIIALTSTKKINNKQFIPSMDYFQ